MNKACLYCTAKFTTNRRRKVYCDMLCQERAKSERQAAKPNRRVWLQTYGAMRRMECAV